MIDREPPTTATWLLTRFGPSYYAESLAGDLIEQFHQGRSRSWYWRQVVVAVFLARIGFVERMLRIAGMKFLGRCLVESALMLCLVTILDRVRHACSAVDMLRPALIEPLIVLAGVALIGWQVWRWADDAKRATRSVSRLMSAFALVALAGLGAGTLTWANTTKNDSCRAAVCSCKAATGMREPVAH